MGTNDMGKWRVERDRRNHDNWRSSQTLPVAESFDVAPWANIAASSSSRMMGVSFRGGADAVSFWVGTPFLAVAGGAHAALGVLLRSVVHRVRLFPIVPDATRAGLVHDVVSALDVETALRGLGFGLIEQRVKFGDAGGRARGERHGGTNSVVVLTGNVRAI
jgi:hypothetical protein